MKIRSFNRNKIGTLLLILLTASSCKKYLDVPLPNDQIASETAFTTKGTIDAVMTGMYNAFAQPTGGISLDYLRLTCYMSDERADNPVPGGDISSMIAGYTTAGISQISTAWNYNYTVIYRANNILENMPHVPAGVLSEAQKKQYTAEARFIRAACHFNAVKSWGDVPIAKTTNVNDNLVSPRKPVAEVYAFIVDDLQAAMADMPATPTDALRVTSKYVAEALLARAYLFMGKWAEAEAAATDVINSGVYQLLPNLAAMAATSAMARGSKEIIFAIGAASTSNFTSNRAYIGRFIPPLGATTSNLSVSLPVTLDFLNSFEPGDKRIVEGNWISTQFGYKYCNKYWYPAYSYSTTASITVPQDFVFLRLAEQYLVRSEARAQQNNISGAAADINVIRTRAGLGTTTATDKPTMLTAIEVERNHELFYEGHRWYDLVRTGRADAVFGSLSYKASNWKPYYKLWPIPQRELLVNPNLVQNPGY